MLFAVTDSATESAHPAWYVMLAAWAYNFLWLILLVASTIFTLLLFPDGLPSRRWRPVLWVAITATTVGVVLAAVAADLTINGRSYPNPVHPAGWGPIANTLFGAAVVTLLICGVLSIVATVVRFRRSTGVERAQLQWFVFAAVDLAVLLLISGRFSQAWSEMSCSPSAPA
jgi:hypothetical protein